MPFLQTAIGIALLTASAVAAAADIDVVALTAGKAMVSINGAKPRTLAVGQTSPEGVKLLVATSESATFEFAGKRQTLVIGQRGALGSATSVGGGSASVTAAAGHSSHTDGQRHIDAFMVIRRFIGRAFRDDA